MAKKQNRKSAKSSSKIIKKCDKHNSDKYHKIIPTTAVTTKISSPDPDLKYDYPFKSVSIYPDLK